MGLALRKGHDGDTDSPLANACDDRDFFDRYGLLGSWLCADEWEGGGRRNTSTLLVFVDQGTWKAAFTDRDKGRITFISASTFQGLLQALETGLQEGRIEWRAHKPFRSNGKKGS